jgi:uncharacterized membrane protein
MPFCPNCGAPVEGRFCAKCGTPTEDAGAGRGAAPPPQGPAAGGLTENAASALCYLLGFITGILFLVLEPYNRNKTVRFHAFQSIFLNVAWFALWIVIHILFGILATITGGLILVLSPLLLLVGLAFFALWLYLMWKAYQNQKVVLPVIGPLAEKQA